ncbi:CD151 antigen-like [Haliotis asinina]|uniref:CD151 antigen-like n=1 Tax=Haliotis asinina TaxID=109174 RepID=UPI003531DE8E
MEDLGTVAQCGRIWLAVFNTVFTILGSACFVLGSVLRFRSDIFISYLSGLVSNVQAEESTFTLSDFIEGIAFTFIVVGLFIFIVGGLGCLGACWKLRTCLLVYAVVVVIVMVTQVVGVTLMCTLKSQFDISLKTLLKRTLSSSYTGDIGTDPVTLGWNYIFMQLDCCGVDNYTDIYTATHWNRTVSQEGLTVVLKTPFTCCKLEGEYPDMDWPVDPYCALSPNSSNSNYNHGCYSALEGVVLGYTTTMIVAGIILAGVEIVSTVLAVLLFRELKNEEEEVFKE